VIAAALLLLGCQDGAYPAPILPDPFLSRPALHERIEDPDLETVFLDISRDIGQPQRRVRMVVVLPQIREAGRLDQHHLSDRSPHIHLS
jgi:hypothetical protein